MKERPSESSSSVSGHFSRFAVGRMSGIASRFFANGSTLQATARMLRRQLWAWPIIAAVLFGGAGWWVYRSVENAMLEQRANELNVMVDASATAFRVWMNEQMINAQLFADDEKLRPLVTELLGLANKGNSVPRQLVQAPAQEQLRQRLKARLARCSYLGYYVVAPNGVVVAADQDISIVNALTRHRKELFD